jgi:hypothetical protein
MPLSPFWVASIWSGTSFVLLFALFGFIYKGSNFFYFNPQDFAKYMKEKGVTDRRLPEISQTATFDSFITQYTGMAKVMIGLAAASISFGGLNTDKPTIFTAKLLLAYSIGFSLIFSITMINFYENYLHDIGSYKPFKIALVEASGLTSVVCFALGYGYWAWHL